MDDFTYFHLCNHRLKKPSNEGEVVTLTVDNSKDLIDTLINGAVVLEIYDVMAIEYDPNDFEIIDFYYDNSSREQTYDDITPGESYYDEKELYVVEYKKYFKPDKSVSEPLPKSFYEPILHNRIRWIVKPPKKYQVSAKVRYTNDSYTNYRPADCPKCGGRGWFVDILSKDGTFEKPVGIIKVAQRIVKDFLTEAGTQLFDPTYGTRVKKEALFYSGDDESLFNMIRMAASEVEDQYLNDQQNMIMDLEPEETLISLMAENVYRSSTKPTVLIIQLRIRTETDQQVFKFGF